MVVLCFNFLFITVLDDLSANFLKSTYYLVLIFLFLQYNHVNIDTFMIHEYQIKTSIRCVFQSIRVFSAVDIQFLF